MHTSEKQPKTQLHLKTKTDITALGVLVNNKDFNHSDGSRFSTTFSTHFNIHNSTNVGVINQFILYTNVSI